MAPLHRIPAASNLVGPYNPDLHDAMITASANSRAIDEKRAREKAAKEAAESGSAETDDGQAAVSTNVNAGTAGSGANRSSFIMDLVEKAERGN